MAGNMHVATLQKQGSNKQIYYSHTDHLGGGSIITGEQAEWIQSLDYYPFGETRINENHANYNERRMFTGHEYDEEIGLYYAQARYYDPAIGRFAGLDPVLRVKPASFFYDSQEQNFYSYTRNNPIMLVDPLGLYNVETGEVEEGDTLMDITNQINEYWNTDYTYLQIAELNKISDPDVIEVGKILYPNNNLPDITFELESKMEMYANDPGIGNPFYFEEKFRDGGDWDLKAQNGIFCTNSKHCSPAGYEYYLFNANVVRYDAPGNILYGYVGASDKVDWLPLASLYKFRVYDTDKLRVLKRFAGNNQETKDVPGSSNCNNDDCTDSYNIEMGYYYEL